MDLIPGQEDPLKEDLATTPVFLPGESPWTEEPVGYSPWRQRESDTAEQLNNSMMHYSISLFGK